MKRSLVTVVFLLGSLFAASASAQTEDGRRAYLDAVAAFKANDMARAATLFRESYELLGEPELLYNEMYAREKMGDVDGARRVAREAFGLDGLPADVDAKLRARLGGWDTRERARNVALAEPVVSKPDPPSTAEPKLVRPIEPTRSATNPLRPTAYVLAGVGVVSLGVAAFSELRVASAATDLDEAAARGDRDAWDDALDRGERFQTVGKASLVTGGVLLGAGIVLFLLSGDERHETSATGLLTYGIGEFSVVF